MESVFSGAQPLLSNDKNIKGKIYIKDLKKAAMLDGVDMDYDSELDVPVISK
jgi:hypothetical protein